MMSRSVQVRLPKPAEIRQLRALEEGASSPRQWRRAAALLLYATGMEAVEIARALAVHPNTIYTDLHAFDRQGWQALQPPPGPAASCGLTAEQIREICALADHPPYEVGLPYGRWSLAKLREYLLKKRVCRHLSREHLRRLLTTGASASGGSGARSSVTTPSGGRSWAASACSGAIDPGRECSCSLLASRSLSKPMGDGGTPPPSAWCSPASSGPGASSTSFCSMT